MKPVGFSSVDDALLAGLTITVHCSRSAAIGAGTYRHRFDSGRETNEDRRGPKAVPVPP